jgi:hypothetical protein
MSGYDSNIPHLGQIIRAYGEALGRPMPEVLEDQANKLCSSNFGDGKLGLFQEAAALAPTRQELFALPVLLNYRIRRRGRPVFTRFTTRTVKRGKNKGKQIQVRAKTAEGDKMKAGEIERRAAARFYNASGWLNPAFMKYAKSRKIKPNGAVSISLNGDVLSVTFINATTKAGEVDARYHYVDRALRNRAEDMLEYINKHIDRVTTNFNAGGRGLTSL